MEPPEMEKSEVAVEQSRFQRFVELPRELRDNIYDACLSEAESQKFQLFAKRTSPEETERPSDSLGAADHIEDVSEETQQRPIKHLGLRASIEHGAPTNVLLCSRKIRQECGERSKQAMTLKLKDCELYGFQSVTLPEQAKGLFWAEIHLILFCYDHPRWTHNEDKLCNAVDEVSKHRRWIEKLVTTQMSELRSFSIHAHLCYNDRRSGYRVETAAPCEAFISKTVMNLCSLPKLKELTLCKLDFHASPELEGPKTVVLKWSSEGKDHVSRTKPKKPAKDTVEQKENLPLYEGSEKGAEFSA